MWAKGTCATPTTRRPCICHPSTRESLSIMILEAWLAGLPCLVHGDCAVTRYHVEQSGGGLWFNDYPTFHESLSYLLEDEARRAGYGGEGEGIRAAQLLLGRGGAQFLRRAGGGGRGRPLRVHQMVPCMNSGDAVSNQVLSIRDILTAWGVESDIFACDMDDFGHRHASFRQGVRGYRGGGGRPARLPLLHLQRQPPPLSGQPLPQGAHLP